MTSRQLRTSAPRARVSRTALAENIRSAVADSVEEDPVADLRHDAWGHGLETVGRALGDGGVRLVRADTIDAALVEDLGLTASGAEPTLPMARVLGLPGSGGEPVLSLVSAVLSTKPLRAGEGVSYGYRHRAAVDTRIALVAGGYAQGVVRALGGTARVDIAGRRHPIVGRVAMDVCVVDIGADSSVEAGDEVVFFGTGTVREELGEWAEATGLTIAELAVAVGLGVAREVVA